MGPKESQEFHDYSFKDHFGKLTPSYIPCEVMRQYLEGKQTFIYFVIFNSWLLSHLSLRYM